jgi:hypothetical protein
MNRIFNLIVNVYFYWLEYTKVSLLEADPSVRHKAKWKFLAKYDFSDCVKVIQEYWPEWKNIAILKCCKLFHGFHSFVYF